MIGCAVACSRPLSMPERDWRILVEDMREHAIRAISHLGDRTLEDFIKDALVQDGVIRCLEIIGEAARHVPEDVRVRAAVVPWGQIVATRHILAHHYARVDLETVWRVTCERLPDLVAALTTLLDEAP